MGKHKLERMEEKGWGTAVGVRRGRGWGSSKEMQVRVIENSHARNM